MDKTKKEKVAPCAGAWIEMPVSAAAAGIGVSLPVRERGLKLNIWRRCCPPHFVAPCAGAWIEIIFVIKSNAIIAVAPCAGAWIEINSKVLPGSDHSSRSLCGSVD